MKKIRSIITCLLCFLLLTACGSKKALPNNITAKNLVDAIVKSAEEPQVNVFYTKEKDPLDAYTMSLWVDGAYQECEEYDLIDDYAVFYSADNSTYEISVLKAKNDADIQKITSVFERRKQTLASGDKAEYDPDFEKIMDSSKIIIEGRFVILIITSDTTSAVNAIENLKQ